MTSDTTIIPLRQPETLEDPLTADLRCGARRLLAQAIEAEAEAFLATMKGVHLPDGHGAWMRCCPSSTYAGFRWATSKRSLPRCWAMTRRTCRRR
jgi:hypothetical protein